MSQNEHKYAGISLVKHPANSHPLILLEPTRNIPQNQPCAIVYSLLCVSQIQTPKFH